MRSTTSTGTHTCRPHKYPNLRVYGIHTCLCLACSAYSDTNIQLGADVERLFEELDTLKSRQKTARTHLRVGPCLLTCYYLVDPRYVSL